VAVNSAAGAPPAARDFLPVSTSWGTIFRVKFPAVSVVFQTASYTVRSCAMVNSPGSSCTATEAHRSC
jgi:hypothetical protein